MRHKNEEMCHMRIRNVLVPVDFSPPSILAANYGTSLARQFRARLILLHVLSKFGANDEERATCAMSMLVSPEDQDDLNILILVKKGEVQRQVEAAVLESHADLVVMGTHGRKFLGRLFIGSVTENLVRRIKTPLMTVCHATRPLEFSYLLFATDLSEAAEKAFIEVLDFARALSASLQVLHVVYPVNLYEASETLTLAQKAQDQYRIEMRARLDRLVSMACREGVPCESILTEGDPEVVILREAEDRSSDLIVIGVANRGAMERAIFGSTAETVIRHARIPVLALHISKGTAGSEEETQIVGHWERR
jgi:nucleotide-binding universal stress UspA family protein